DHDIRRLTVEPQPIAAGRHREAICASAADELQRVLSVAAFEQVAAVARVPDEHVRTTLAVHVIRSSAADEQIVALAAVQIIRSAKTEDEVVAVPAVDEISTRAAGEEVVSGSAQDGGVG